MFALRGELLEHEASFMFHTVGSTRQDRSGYISLDELLTGYDRLPEFQEQMRLMDVEREDMQLDEWRR